jgi:biopolymer transport protein ExbB
VTDLEETAARDASAEALLRRVEGVPGSSPRIARIVLRENPGSRAFHEIFARAREMELEPYEASLRVLAALVVAAPLLGLLGTVLGMVETFDAVATRSSETTDMVARGISRALITTQAGLVAALPGTFGIAHLSRLLRRLRGRIDAFEFRLDRMLEPAGRAPAGAGEATP